MKHIPILFSTPMVQSEQAGRKTQTRRTRGLKEINENPNDWEFVRLHDGYAKFCQKGNWTNERHIKCPYGQAGDILWMRETWAHTTNVNHWDSETWPSRPHIRTDGDDEGTTMSAIIYQADGWWDWCDDDGFDTEKSYWRPSIHMPKTACRTFLLNKSVRVERVQDISPEDAIAEGIERVYGFPFVIRWKDYTGQQEEMEFPESSFSSLWKSINGEQSWNDNPWVWCVTFEKVNLSDDERMSFLSRL